VTTQTLFKSHLKIDRSEGEERRETEFLFLTLPRDALLVCLKQDARQDSETAKNMSTSCNERVLYSQSSELCYWHGHEHVKHSKAQKSWLAFVLTVLNLRFLMSEYGNVL
jgi:hypothetical protein